MNVSNETVYEVYFEGGDCCGFIDIRAIGDDEIWHVTVRHPQTQELLAVVRGDQVLTITPVEERRLP